MAFNRLGQLYGLPPAPTLLGGGGSGAPPMRAAPAPVPARPGGGSGSPPAAKPPALRGPAYPTMGPPRATPMMMPLLPGMNVGREDYGA